ncbi:MAG: hypothetical protein AAFQ47_12610 [Pseudomonadota bacterium]
MPELLLRLMRLTGLTTLALTVLCGVLNTPIATTALLCLTATAALWSAAILDRRAGGIDFLIAFFFLFFLAIPARLQIAHQTFPWGGSYSAQTLNHTYALIATALLCYTIARLSARQAKPRQAPQLPDKSLHRWAFALTLISIAIAALIGPGNLFVLRSSFLDGATNSLTSQLIYIGRALSLLTFVLCLYLLAQPRPTQGPTLALTALAAATCLSFNYPPALPRFALFGCAIALLSIRLNLFSPRLKLALALTAPPLLFLLFPAVKMLGHAERGVLEMAQIMAQTDPTLYLLRVDFDGFKQIADTLVYLETAPLRWGANYAGVLLFFVPRALWPAKPTDSGELVSATLGYPYTNVSSPLPAEALLAFGIPGVLLTFLALGAVTARIEGNAQARQTLHHLVLYSITMGFITIVLRGALNGVAPQFATAFLAYAAITWRARA